MVDKPKFNGLIEEKIIIFVTFLLNFNKSEIIFYLTLAVLLSTISSLLLWILLKKVYQYIWVHSNLKNYEKLLITNKPNLNSDLKFLTSYFSNSLNDLVKDVQHIDMIFKRPNKINSEINRESIHHHLKGFSKS